MPRLKWVEVRGLRSFGIEQSLIFDEDIALIWGGNSQGKTSVAEAVEFLLSGTVVRPVMLGGAKNEYDRSLRNAYMPDDEPTVVRAGIDDADGNERRVERELTADFGRGQDCASRLTIDGVEVADLSSIGIHLAEPPLQAPVLFQHSIRYALSAAPTDRLTYFKALFEIGDLDALADSLKSVIEGLAVPRVAMDSELAACAGDAAIDAIVGDLRGDDSITEAAFSERLANACRAGLAALTGQEPEAGASLQELADALRGEVSRAQGRRFDLAAWRPGPVPATPVVTLDAASAYVDAVASVDRDVEQLRGLYEAVLKVPAFEHLDDGVQCPVCDDGTLTAGRLEVLRSEVAAGSDLRARQVAARQELQRAASALRATSESAGRLAPRAARFEFGEAAEAEASASAVLGEPVSLGDAHRRAQDLGSAAASVADSVSVAAGLVDAAAKEVDLMGSFDVDEISAQLMAVTTACDHGSASRETFLAEASPVLGQVSERLNEEVGTTGWDAVVRLAGAVVTTVLELGRARAVAQAKAEYAQALATIERAKLEVFRDKFADMSDEILKWWNRLRPDEPVVFERAEPRAGGRRFVDLKAKLSAGGIVEERDALGIFSDSQLNALGLAAFLARAILQGVPFVILDDPVQAGDDEHRDTFIDVVLPALVGAGIQVIVTSHDSHMRTLLSNVHAIDGFTVTLDEPEKGTVVIKGTDTAEALLDEVKGFIKETPSLRDTGAQKMRVAAERLAKEILVQKRQNAGERASLGDYKKWTLEKLVPKLCEVLDDDTEKGNWKNVSPRLSPGAHDDAPPAKNTLKRVRDQLMTSHKRHIKDARTGAT